MDGGTEPISLMAWDRRQMLVRNKASDLYRSGRNLHEFEAKFPILTSYELIAMRMKVLRLYFSQMRQANVDSADSDAQ